MEDDYTKITSAVYKILDFLPDTDPLKNKAKEKALAILENATIIQNIERRSNSWVSLEDALGQGYGIAKEQVKVQILDDIGILEGYLKVGRHLGWIDNVNFLIIMKEYGLIEASFRKQALPAQIQYSHDSEVTNSHSQNLRHETRVEKEDIKKYSPRQLKILEILNKKEKAQVSDFIKELPNVTKRTIRRDLDNLLKKSTVARIGEWNQVFYKLNSKIFRNSKQ